MKLSEYEKKFHQKLAKRHTKHALAVMIADMTTVMIDCKDEKTKEKMNEILTLFYGE